MRAGSVPLSWLTSQPTTSEISNESQAFDCNMQQQSLVPVTTGYNDSMISKAGTKLLGANKVLKSELTDTISRKVQSSEKCKTFFTVRIINIPCGKPQMQRSWTKKVALLAAGFSHWGETFKTTCLKSAQGLHALLYCICAALALSKQRCTRAPFPSFFTTCKHTAASDLCIFNSKHTHTLASQVPATYSGHNLSPFQRFLQLQVMPRGATCL